MPSAKKKQQHIFESLNNVVNNVMYYIFRAKTGTLLSLQGGVACNLIISNSRKAAYNISLNHACRRGEVQLFEEKAGKQNQDGGLHCRRMLLFFFIF